MGFKAYFSRISQECEDCLATAEAGNHVRKIHLEDPDQCLGRKV